MVKVLFVCMGNICRSPSAEGVFRQRVDQSGLSKHIKIDSAGTHSYHVGSPPDKRAQQAAMKRGVDLSRLKARRVDVKDFAQFDYVLAMDAANMGDLIANSAPEFHEKINLFLDFASSANETDVPDPYYGGRQGFEYVLDLVEQAAEGLLQHIVKEHGLKIT